MKDVVTSIGCIARALPLMVAVCFQSFGQNSATKPTVVPTEVVIVRKSSISPQTITRPAGTFVLYLENRSAAPNENYRLDVDGQAITATTTPLASFATQNANWTSQTPINLPAGTYRLSLQNQSSLSLQLVITK
jgi:hypothetical protein